MGIIRRQPELTDEDASGLRKWAHSNNQKINIWGYPPPPPANSSKLFKMRDLPLKYSKLRGYL